MQKTPQAFNPVPHRGLQGRGPAAVGFRLTTLCLCASVVQFVRDTQPLVPLPRTPRRDHHHMASHPPPLQPPMYLQRLSVICMPDAFDPSAAELPPRPALHEFPRRGTHLQRTTPRTSPRQHVARTGVPPTIPHTVAPTPVRSAPLVTARCKSGDKPVRKRCAPGTPAVTSWSTHGDNSVRPQCHAGTPAVTSWYARSDKLGPPE
jgi:hypothetical protein